MRSVEERTYRTTLQKDGITTSLERTYSTVTQKDRMTINFVVRFHSVSIVCLSYTSHYEDCWSQCVLSAPSLSIVDPHRDQTLHRDKVVHIGCQQCWKQRLTDQSIGTSAASVRKVFATRHVKSAVSANKVNHVVSDPTWAAPTCVSYARHHGIYSSSCLHGTGSSSSSSPTRSPASALCTSPDSERR